MLSKKYRFIALGLLFLLTGLVNVSAQTQKKKKDREILTEGPKPFVQLSDHPATLSPCSGSESSAIIPLTATVTNFSTTPLRYSWRVSGGRLHGEGAEATRGFTGGPPGK